MIFVKVKTKAKNKRITKINDDHYMISVNAVPEKGKANKEMIKALSKYFDMASSKIKIISGETSKNKILELLS